MADSLPELTESSPKSCRFPLSIRCEASENRQLRRSETAATGHCIKTDIAKNGLPKTSTPKKHMPGEPQARWPTWHSCFGLRLQRAPGSGLEYWLFSSPVARSG